LLVFLILVAGEGSTLDDNTLTFIGTLPGWLLWLAQAAYLLGVLYALGLLIGVGVFAKGRLEFLRDMILAAALAVVFVLALTQFIDNRWPELAFFDLQQTRDTFPAFFVTTSAAIQAAASPHLTAPMRKLGWAFILSAVVASVIGGVTTVSDALGGLLVGLIAAAVIRYVFGTSAGLPSTNRVRAGLADLGVQMAELRYADDQPRHRSSWSARRPMGSRCSSTDSGATRGTPAERRGCGGRRGIATEGSNTGPIVASRSNTSR
jgi:hypothetical protein